MTRLLIVLVALFLPLAAMAEDFESWKARFADKAVAAGIPQSVVTQELSDLTPDPAVIKLDRAQPEFFRSAGSYLNKTVTQSRINRGRELLITHASLLDQLERASGVTGTLPIAIWGIETNFGEIMGQMDVVRSLATLAYDGRRRIWAEDELIAALRLIADGTPRTQLKGSWAGAFGHTQFMPTTALRLAVDGDGDGGKDLFTPPDALASASRYLEKSGWRRGEPWLIAVQYPAGTMDWGDNDAAHLKDWIRRGFVPLNGLSFASDWGKLQTRLILPMGFAGPAFLAFPNFEVIKRYNASTSYALAVGQLANHISRDMPVIQWPEFTLARNDVMAMQGQLKALGFEPGQIDGQLGPQTRMALKGWQLQAGLPADGFPGPETLARLLNTGLSTPPVAAAVSVAVPPMPVDPQEKPHKKRHRGSRRP